MPSSTSSSATRPLRGRGWNGRRALQEQHAETRLWCPFLAAPAKAESCVQRLSTAERLVSGLADENERSGPRERGAPRVPPGCPGIHQPLRRATQVGPQRWWISEISACGS